MLLIIRNAVQLNIQKSSVPYDIHHEYFRQNTLTHLSRASFLLDVGKQYSHRCDAAERGVLSVAILFAKRIFIKKLYKV